MEKRLRPITYAEALHAKELAEKNDTNIIDDPPKEEISHIKSSINSVKIELLPSGGQDYPENSEIYFTPFSFGEMKFLSGSSLSDPESINFFLSKIQTSFPKEDLTYYDFYFITIMIKMASFGEIEYKMNFECLNCGHHNKIPFNISDLEFDEIRVPLPITIDLLSPFTASESGEILEKITFTPISIGRYKKMITDGTTEDYDVYMSNCIKDGSEEDRLKIIKEYLNGTDVNLLETIDVTLYHGVKDIKMTCKNKIPKDANNADAGEEVCGRSYDIPFQSITEYISSTDKLKESLGKRIHFGV